MPAIKTLLESNSPILNSWDWLGNMLLYGIHPTDISVKDKKMKCEMI